MFKVYDVRVNYAINPIGVSNNLRFSWKLSSDARNVKQEKYILTISTDEKFQEVVARKEGLEESIAVKIEDLKLTSLTKYFIRVESIINTGESSVNESAYFVTAYLDNEELVAKMISAETEEDKDNSKATYLRKEFRIKGKVKSAYLCSTAFGLYNVYLDGKKVGQDELTPGWTSYKNHLLYQIYDVADILNVSESHCLGALVGAGFYKGLMGFLHQRNNYGKQTGFFAQLAITYEDGTRELIVSDESFKGADSPILFSEIYDGENYDARREIAGWNETGLEDDRFRAVNIVPLNKSTLTPQFACKPRMMEAFEPKKIFKTPEGDLVIDFGQNLAGFISIELEDTKEGEVVELDCFETLDSKGNVYVDNLRGAKNRFVYTCKGGKKESYHPHFTYQGYRYAKVVSWAGKELTESKVKSNAVYSNMEKIGDFSCSNHDLNQLWSNIGWSLRSNFVDIPTDCPQRNERVGWTGDAQIFCPTANYIMNTYLFFEKWLIDVAYDQTEEGGVPHVVPDIVTPTVGKVQDWLCSQGSHSAAAWADVAVLNPWNIYLAYGDKQILIDQYESMKKWIDFMEAHANGIIWNYKLQFGDWVALDAEEGSYFGATPNDLTCTAYYAYSTGVFAKVAKLLGKTEDAKYYKKLEEKIKKGFAETFFDKNTLGMTVQTQTAHIVALYFDLTPEEYKETTAKELVDLLKKENGHLVTGFVGTPYFTHALSQNGYLKEAYELLLKDDFPSWLYQVKQGATTIWEHWDGLKPDGTMWSPDMNSFNHYAYGAIGEWLIKVMVGINTVEEAPGYKRIKLYPRIGGGLTAAAGSLMTMYGKLECGWKVDKDKVTINVEVPVNTTAEFRMDNVKGMVDNGKTVGSLSGNTYLASLGSGSYEFSLMLAEQ